MLADAVSPAQVKRELLERGYPREQALRFALEHRSAQGTWLCRNVDCVRHNRGVSAGHVVSCTCCGGPVEVVA